MGRSSGQRVYIENKTKYTFKLIKTLDVCGETEHNPNCIESSLDEDGASGISYLQNHGRRTYYGSEIVYIYEIRGTPDSRMNRWILRIYSIGAYQLRNHCFAAQVVLQNARDRRDPGPIEVHGRSDSGASGGSSERLEFWQKVFDKQTGKVMNQVCWRNPTTHHWWNPDPSDDGVNRECPFSVKIVDEPKELPQEGSGFYQINLKIAMRPMVVRYTYLSPQKCIKKEKFSGKVCQSLLPGGQNILEYKDTEHMCTCVKQTLERQWHRVFNYKESFEWGVSIGSGSKEKEKGKESSGTVGLTFGGNYSWETSSTNVQRDSNEWENKVTYTREYYWRYIADIKEAKKVSISITKKTYRQDLISDKGLVVGYKETSSYDYHPHFVDK